MIRDDTFASCHPLLNFFYFVVVLGFTMFVQHPVFLGISFLGAACYGIWLNGWKRTLKQNLFLTLPGLLIVALTNPLFNHYGVTVLFYLESSGNNITLEALVYGIVLGCVLFIVIAWFSCYNQIMTSDKFIYLFGKLIPALSLILSMALRFVPRFSAQIKTIRNGQKCSGKDISNAKFVKKAQYGLSILSILVTWALENAIDTADSMKSRGYGLTGRTAFSIYRFDKRDKIMGCILVGLFGIFTWGCAQGAAFAQYDPRILLAGFVIQGHVAPVTCSIFVTMITFAAFAAFCFAPIVLGILEEHALKKTQSKVSSEAVITYRRIYEEIEKESMTI